MPEVINYTCDFCGYSPRDNITHRTYVVDNEGNRIKCFANSRISILGAVLGFDASQGLIKQKTGVWYGSVCLDCLDEFNLDYNKDELKCPQCSSTNISPTYKLANQNCPKCKSGIIISTMSGFRV